MIRALLITVVGASLLSCLIVPIVFDLLNSLAAGSPWPFSRVFDRVFLFFLLIFIVCFRRDFNLSSIRDALRRPNGWRQRAWYLLAGVLISSGSVGLCMIGVFSEGGLVTNPRSAADIATRLLKLVPGALLIALVEELFFRVLLLKRLQDFMPLWLSVGISSLLYAIVHFITPQRSFVYRGDSWLEGFGYVPALLQRLLEPGTEIGIAGLFVVGLLLSFAMVRLGSIYLAIGMHTGWICALKMTSFLSLRNMEEPLPVGLGGRYSLLGEEWAWLSFVLVLIVLGVLVWGKKNRKWMEHG